MLGASAQSPARADKPFSSGVEITSVTATVTDKDGRLIHDLPQDLFEIYEDGVKQTVTQFTRDRVPVGLGVLLDVSDSMYGQRIQDAVRRAVPPKATVIVVSKGDAALLELDGRPAWHFPRAESGDYAGYYPADAAEAITQLENLRAAGGDFLVFPHTAFWWLESYPELRHHLVAHYRRVHSDQWCLIYGLRPAGRAPQAGDTAVAAA